MTATTKFNVEDFLVKDEGQTEVPIWIPQGLFRINPDPERMIGPVYLSRAGDQWRLVSSEVVGSYRVPSLWQAELYEGVLPDGTVFVLPATYPKPGGEEWFNSLQQAIGLARTQWIAIQADHTLKCYEVLPAVKKKPLPPEWFECEFAEVVEVAFTDRIVRTRQDAEKCFPKKQAKRVFREEFEE